MADNYLERHREEYERKKADWLQRKSKPSAKQILKRACARFSDE